MYTLLGVVHKTWNSPGYSSLPALPLLNTFPPSSILLRSVGFQINVFLDYLPLSCRFVFVRVEVTFVRTVLQDSIAR